MFRTYSGSLNNNIESLSMFEGIGFGAFANGKILSSTFIPSAASCQLIIGDSVQGITGTITDFRIWHGTGAIPGGDVLISAKNCPQSVGLFKGTHDPCVASCSDINCIACTTSTTVCEACNSGNYLLNNGVNPAYCVPSCPYGSAIDSTNRICTLCSVTGKFLYNNNCLAACPGGWGTDASSVCIQCTGGTSVSSNNVCVAKCLAGWIVDASSNCVDCAVSGKYYYNNTCVAECPYGYNLDAPQNTCFKCPQPQYYFNHTCLTSCPKTTFTNSTAYECQPCFLGCDSCTDSTNTSCTVCSAGYFLNGGFCGSGCPPDKYANLDTRTCEPCQPPCLACSRPSNLYCTNCPASYFLMNGECVTSCPDRYYQTFHGVFPDYQVHACLERLVLEFNLTLAKEARTVLIHFNYSIAGIVNILTSLFHVEMGSVEVDSISYALTSVDNSTIKFQYLGEQYYAALTVLKITLDLATYFNNDPYQVFRQETKSKTIQIKEIYPFSQTEIQVIGTTADITSFGGAAMSGGQAASSVAGGALSLSLVRMQIIGEVVQMMRFIDIGWPPNIQDLYSETKSDPNSIVVQIDLIQSWNEYLEDRNTSMPRSFQAYEVSPFFTENYNSEISNIFILSIITVFGFVITSFLRKKLQVFTAKHTLPKANAVKSFRDRLVEFLHSVSRLLNRFDPTIFWNFALLFTLSVFQPGVFWSFININYYSTVVEPHTAYTKATLAIAVISLVLYLSLMGFVFYAVISNFKHFLNTKESLQPAHIKSYRNLFEDFGCQNKFQLLFVPISMLKSLLYGLTLVFLSPYPIAQITVIWVLSAAFIVHMIIKRPLKDRWTRIITLVVELFGFGCMTIGFVLPIVESAVELDASTRVEIGFVFIAFTITSTAAGCFLTLIQILALFISVYKYVRNKHRRRNQVKPISLVELGSESPSIQEENARRTIEINSLKESTPRVNSGVFFPKSHLSIDLDKQIGRLSTKVLSRSPRGIQLLENIKTWFQEHPSEAGYSTRDLYKSPKKM